MEGKQDPQDVQIKRSGGKITIDCGSDDALANELILEISRLLKSRGRAAAIDDPPPIDPD
jgi:hypothetical protein